MKKILTTIIFFFAMVSIQAQDIKEVSLKVDSLQLKLDKLQRDYDYLYCEYQLNKLNSDVKIFTNELKTTTNQLISHGLNNNYTDGLYKGYKMNYEEYLKSYDSYKSLFRAVIFNITARIENSNFHEQEINVLKSFSDAIEQALNTTKVNLDYQKDVLELYKNLK